MELSLDGIDVKVSFAEGEPARKCGECTACCKIMPVPPLHKVAGQRCQHQRRTGCRIYADRPRSCAEWACRWLTFDDAGSLRRPDRSHVVVDMLPDTIAIDRHDGSGLESIAVIQVWVDAAFPDAHQDAGLRAYLAMIGERDGVPALIRYGSKDGFVLWPPALTGAGWRESRSNVRLHRPPGDRHPQAAPAINSA